VIPLLRIICFSASNHALSDLKKSLMTLQKKSTLFITMLSYFLVFLYHAVVIKKFSSVGALESEVFL